MVKIIILFQMSVTVNFAEMVNIIAVFYHFLKGKFLFK